MKLYALDCLQVEETGVRNKAEFRVWTLLRQLSKTRVATAPKQRTTVRARQLNSSFVPTFPKKFKTS